ncbi:MAG: hypothetical protein HJJLKODD_01972 [Phycisphaerae bacterium]|nr:hypothetical protein [Phycisphaerae bacterium]
MSRKMILIMLVLGIGVAAWLGGTAIAGTDSGSQCQLGAACICGDNCQCANCQCSSCGCTPGQTCSCPAGECKCASHCKS